MNTGKGVGAAAPLQFNQESAGIDIARQLENWQGTSDERLWKMIVSPGFGDRIDLSRLTLDLVRQMEKDLGASLLVIEHWPDLGITTSDRDDIKISGTETWWPPDSGRFANDPDGHASDESLAKRRHRISILVVVALTSLLPGSGFWPELIARAGMPSTLFMGLLL